MKITKRARMNKGTYSTYYQVIPEQYHYVNVKKPLLIYNNKHFTKRTRHDNMRKGITICVKRLIKDGNELLKDNKSYDVNHYYIKRYINKSRHSFQ